MKKILGLDLGTNSIGWAYVNEAEADSENSKIIKTGVRVMPLTSDEKGDFEKGKSISINADRTLKRGARRNLHRYKLRKNNLIEILKRIDFVNDNTIFAENDKNTTHSTYQLRAKAASEKIGKEELARVLLMINKKRGYKSSRKAKNEEEGQAIDGMAVAKKLYEEKLTPGQYSYHLFKEGGKYLPDYYRSDLESEFDSIWNFQKQFYPEIFNEINKEELKDKGKRASVVVFEKQLNIELAEIKGNRDEKKLKTYEWRSKAVNQKFEVGEVAFVLAEINNNINNSSGYLGAISDRSKELYFNKETVGQYLYKQLQKNPHVLTKNQVFYRQDYLDEFEKIWSVQSASHPVLTNEIKTEIRDVIIFYQRRLKSQKHLISECEFEKHHKAIPKSSPLFQEFKIWQNLNNIVITNKDTKEPFVFDNEAKEHLFEELNIKGNLSKTQVLKALNVKSNDWDLNFTTIEGNRTNQVLYEAYQKILEYEGNEIDFSKLSAVEIKSAVNSIFESLGINTQILSFNSELEGNAFDKQLAYQFWHLLYSYEDDNSNSGNEKLLHKLEEKYGFRKEYAQLLVNVSLQQDYGSLSAKAIKKILPYLKESIYDKACTLAGYNHSSSFTKEENEKRKLKDELVLLPKNSLRNPIVEKILNQMVNVINAIIENPEMGKPDEIRIELARELKKGAKERQEMTTRINKSKDNHEKIRNMLITDFGIKNPTRNDIIRYKLYEELKDNGYKTLYTNTYIPREKLFSKEFDIEHIIPQSRLFDDSFSNKTISVRQINIDKSNDTAVDFLQSKLSAADFEQYLARVESLYKKREIGKAKHNKLLMKGDKIPDGFIERDLRDSQYIAKKAKQMLEEICREVTTTTGSVTGRLREDWGIINVMQELNIEKYRKLGLTESIEKKDGSFKERIKDWSKRNDHRHHAMDAITVAFTKRSHIQYLNNLNARSDKSSSIYGIEQKELFRDSRNKLIFKPPVKNFRDEAKKHLESILISCKAKNKVVTKNKNRIRIKGKDNFIEKTELTPRGQLHKETVYGKIGRYKSKEVKIGSKFDEETINMIAKKSYREALLKRLNEFGGDSKKAFAGTNSLTKKPIYLDEEKLNTVPEKVKLVWLENDYTIRKDITPDLKTEKVIDVGIKKLLEKRIEDYNGDRKTAFSNLDKNPIWLNQEKGIAIKRVTISGVSNAEPLHIKKDHLGNELKDKNGKVIPADFVSTGNNHHVAIYKDEKGNLQEEVVSFYEAVARKNEGLSIIKKQHEKGWEFLFTMKQNEYFIFPSNDFDPTEIDLLNPDNYYLISPNLFRVQKIGSADYWFRHHLETMIENKKTLNEITYKRINSTGHLNSIVKIRINHLGQIVRIGEY